MDLKKWDVRVVHQIMDYQAAVRITALVALTGAIN
jgi:hypothetical protein